ncbi:hypothetical protein GCM10010191_62680 [Actinomadura vinacea]|uniref:DUF11 domain-containing protein n=1 Tax=Actinomadura vinacea TaxID=115336 RepID=A0ABN3JSC5_9ACTN
MKSSVRIAVLAATAAAGTAATAPPSLAQAEGRVVFAYSAPVLSPSGDRVVWRWTIRNTGDLPVEGVTLVHRLKPKLKVTSISAPCKAPATGIRCAYERLGPGQRKQGMLTADLPSNVSGLVEIEGRVTWRPAAAPAPGSATPEREEGPEPRPKVIETGTAPEPRPKTSAAITP